MHAPPPRPLVAPSILASDFARVGEEARDVLEAGGDLLHLDVMDGHFVPNLTMGPDMVKALRRALPEAFLDVHLMVERPELLVESFAGAGANLCSFHLEVSSPFHPAGLDAEALIGRIRELGMAAGMVINPYTPAEPLKRWLDQLDLVLVMSVVPGFGGQAFMEQVLAKVTWLANHAKPGTRIEIDGGIDANTAKQAVAAGAEVLVAGSAIFKAADRAAVIEQLHNVDLPARPI